MTAASVMPRAFAVWWKDLERWNVGYFRLGRWHWPPHVLKRLADFTTPALVPISAGQAQGREIPIISKINFDGQLFLRGSEDYATYKGRLFIVPPNCLIFSKINAKRGCIYFSPTKSTPFAVSSEYPVLKLDTEKALGEYVNLALRLGPARETLLGSASGMAKVRTNLKDFQNIVIPLPSLTEQKTIIEHWQKAQDAIRAAQKKVKQYRAEIDARFLADLGLRSPNLTTMPKAFAVMWKDLQRWGVGFNYLNQSSADLTRGKYPLIQGRDCLNEIRHGYSGSPSPKPTNLEILKISAVTRGVFDPTEKKFSYDNAYIREEFSLAKGDVLVCRTNGTLAYVGMSALVPEDIPNMIFPDKVIRIRTKNNILPEYLWYILQSSPIRPQIAAAARTAVGNYAIGTEDIWNLQIPLPPLSVQNEIMERVAASRAEIAREREEADRLSRDINAEIEAMILGVKPLKIGKTNAS